MHPRYSTALKTMIAAALSLTVALPTTGAAGAATTTLTKPGATANSRVPLSATEKKMVTLVTDMVAAMQRGAPAGAPPGVWNAPVTCWRCDAGPAWALAASAALTTNPTQRNQAVAILDRTIAAYQQPNGSFAGTTGSPDIDTMFFAVELGSSAIALRSYLSVARKAAWTSSIRAAADFLVANGNLGWYTNGNINIGNTYVMALAHRLTGDVRYQAHYETALSLAVSPPQQRWPGYGLHYTKTPTRADGSDGKAYFAEAGAGGIGYDPEYTVLQLEMLTKIFLATRDSRVLRSMNLLANQLLDRVDRKTWMLDASKGTRHTDARRLIHFDTAALQTLVNLGRRTDLARHLTPQLAAIDREFRTDVPGLGDRAKYALGMITSSIIASVPANSRLR